VVKHCQAVLVLILVDPVNCSFNRLSLIVGQPQSLNIGREASNLVSLLVKFVQRIAVYVAFIVENHAMLRTSRRSLAFCKPLASPRPRLMRRDARIMQPIAQRAKAQNPRDLRRRVCDDVVERPAEVAFSSTANSPTSTCQRATITPHMSSLQNHAMQRT